MRARMDTYPDVTTIKRKWKNDPASRAEAAATALHALQEQADAYRAIRDQAVEELLTPPLAWRPVDVANLIGVTRAAVAQRWPADRPTAKQRGRRKA